MASSMPERHQHIHHAANGLIDGATVVPGDPADDHADDCRDAHHNYANQQRDPCAEQYPRQDVASEFVEAEPVLPRGPLQAIGQVLRGGVPRQHPRRGNRRKHDGADDQRPEACLP